MQQGLVQLIKRDPEIVDKKRISGYTILFGKANGKVIKPIHMNLTDR